MHGYGVATAVHERTDGDLAVEDAALYQALHRLDRQGLVDAEWRPSENNRRARYYALTPAGRKRLRRRRQLAPLFPRGRGRAAGRVVASHARTRPSRRPFWYLRRRPDAWRPRSTRNCACIWRCGSRNCRPAGMSPSGAPRSAQAVRGSGTHAAVLPAAAIGKEKRVQRSLMFAGFRAATSASAFEVCCRAPLLTLTIVATVGLGIGATTVDLQRRSTRRSCGRSPTRIPTARADLHRRPSQHVSLLGRRLSRARGAADALRADRRVHRPADGVQRRRRRRAPAGTPGVVDLLALLGIRPALGRPSPAADGRPGSPPAVIVSYGFWQRRLGGRADIIGTTVRLERRGSLVRGPAAAGRPAGTAAGFLRRGAMGTPAAQGPVLHDGARTSAPESGHAAAAAELRGINRRIFPLWQASYQDAKATWGMTDLKTHVVGDVRPWPGSRSARSGWSGCSPARTRRTCSSRG